MTDLQCLQLVLDLSPQACERFYRDQNAVVLARCRDGRRVQFPARILRPHLTHRGVCGEFRLCYDVAGRFVRLERLD